MCILTHKYIPFISVIFKNVMKSFLNWCLFPFNLKVNYLKYKLLLLDALGFMWYCLITAKHDKHQCPRILHESRWILQFKPSHPQKRSMLQKNGSYSLPRALAKFNQFNWQTLLCMLSILPIFFSCGCILYRLDVIVVKITLKIEQWQNWWSLRCSVKSQLRDISCSAQIQMLTPLTL